MVVGACQSFNFQNKIPGFSKATELYLNVCMKFCIITTQATFIESMCFVSLKLKSDVNTLLKENLLNIQKDTGVNLK